MGHGAFVGRVKAAKAAPFQNELICDAVRDGAGGNVAFYGR
jgi:hypothetical protein